MDIKNFKEVVAGYIDYDHFLGTYKWSKALELAAKFNCDRATVIYWAAGASDPEPDLKKDVINYILKEILTAAVADYISYNSVSGAFNHDKMRELADEFECIPGTVVQWASGAANANPRIKLQIIEYIRKQTVARKGG